MSHRPSETVARRGDRLSERQGGMTSIAAALEGPLTGYLIALALLILGAVYYLDRIAQWFAYDDEGGYLYAAWRIGAGELPYRDFLTPKLPAFLYPGALILRLTENSVFSLRAFSALLTLASMGLLYLTLRRLWGDRIALVAMVPYVIQRDMFWAARFFRPEAYMLFWDALGLYLFVLCYGDGAVPGTGRTRWGLAASGVAFALSTLSNQFGLLPLVGCLLFMAARVWRGRPWRTEARAALWLGVPCVVVGGLVAAVFLYLAPDFLRDVMGHHLRQGRQLTMWQVALKGLVLYWDYLRGQPILLSLAAIGVFRTIRRTYRRNGPSQPADTVQELEPAVDGAREVPPASIFAWQLPTVLAFSLISRDLQARHFVYLVPALVALAAIGLDPLWEAKRQNPGRLTWRAAGIVLLLAAALYPSWRDNRRVAGLWERDTQRLASYIQAHTAAGDYVLSDYPGLNFFALRKATPTAAGLSRGAAKSGQIMGQDLISEIEAYDVQMVLLNVAQGAHQLANLPDYALFKQYVQTHFALAERTVHHYRLLEIYARQDLWPGEIVSVGFSDTLRLTGLQWMRAEAAPGGDVQLNMRWQSRQPMTRDYLVTLTLHDEAANQWGLGSKQLVDVDTETYWDERGLEQAVLIPTSQWPVAETTVGAFELPIDLGTPPGVYTALVRVHPPSMWEGLPVLSPGGAPSGFDYPVGQVRVLPAPEPPALERLEIAHAREADVGQGIRLLGWDISATDARPGDKLHLSLFWEALRSVPEDYAAELRLVGGAGQLGGVVRFYPAGSQYPTSRWRPGEVLRGQIDLVADAAAPPGPYALTLSLVDGAGETVQGSDVELGTVAVSGRQRTFDLPAVIQHPLPVEFGGVVRLLGYDLPQADLSAGDVLSLTLYWQAIRRMDTSYTVFTHLIDGHGRIWGQRDNVPVQGSYPTTGWLPDEVVVDAYEISARDDAPEASYRLEVGLYDAATGIRLPVLETSAQDGSGTQVLVGDHLLLPEEITLQEER